MNKLIVLLLFLSTFAQAQGFEFSKSSLSSPMATSGVVELKTKEYVMVNHFREENWKLLLTKLDEDGNPKNEAVFGYSDVDLYGTGIYNINDSIFLVVASSSKLDSMIWVGLFNTELEIVDEQFYYTEFSKIPNINSRLESDSVLLVSGFAENSSMYAGKIDFVNKQSVLALDANSTDFGFDIIPRRDSIGYLILGDGNYYLTDEKFKLTSIKERTSGVSPNPYLYGSLVNGFSDTTYFSTAVAHLYSSTPNIDTSAFLVGELGMLGAKLVNRKLLAVTPHDDQIDIINYPALKRSIGVNNEFEIVYVGGTSNIDVDDIDQASTFVLGKFDKDLNKLWEKEYGDSSMYYLMFGVLATSDGGCLMYGYREQYTQGLDKELYVLKVDADGILLGESIIPLTSHVSIYPNPSMDLIRVDLPIFSHEANLVLVDLSGSVVLAQKTTNQVPIDVSFLPKGVYAYQIKSLNGQLMGAGKLVKE